jgi:hypothetical protein
MFNIDTCPLETEQKLYHTLNVCLSGAHKPTYTPTPTPHTPRTGHTDAYMVCPPHGVLSSHGCNSLHRLQTPKGFVSCCPINPDFIGI